MKACLDRIERSDSDDDDSVFLAEAAEMWAMDQEEAAVVDDEEQHARQPAPSSAERKRRPGDNHKKKKHKMNQTSPMTNSTAAPVLEERRVSEDKTLYSVHLTQLAYSTSQTDIQQHLFDGGCSYGAIRSIRLVYDKNGDEGRVFRGVAFVDLHDEASFQKVLKLHRTKLRGRAINVRPTKSSAELNQIVQLTQEKVKATIQRNREKKKRQQQGDARQQDEVDQQQTKRQKTRTSAKHSDRKPTKKERNRRAAVIRQRQQARQKRNAPKK